MSQHAVAFKYLLGKKDNQISKYDIAELKNLLGMNEIHSPKISDAGDEKDDKGHLYINVHGLSWRSSEV